jgi:hypothetical protein
LRRQSAGSLAGVVFCGGKPVAVMPATFTAVDPSV